MQAERSRVTSQVISKVPNELEVDGPDLLIGAATWDVRSTSIAHAKWLSPPQRTLVLDYADHGVTGRLKIHRDFLVETFESVSDVTFLPVDAASPTESWSAVKEAVVHLYASLKRPLHIAVDLNSIPRQITLSLMGFGNRTGIIASLTSIYSAASDYTSQSEVTRFSEGPWRPRAVPTLGKGASPSSRSLLVVAAGFEGANTLRLVNAIEPDRVLIAISQGIRDQHDQLARKANVQLAEDFPSRQALMLPVQDMRAAVAELSFGIKQAAKVDHRPVAVSFLVCGTKLSALAVGVYALDGEVAQVYYPVPKRRIESSATSIEWVTAVRVAL